MPTALPAVLFAVAFAAAVPPSDPVACYATIDKVVLLPDAQQPTQVELHGAFALAEGVSGSFYRAPERGVLRAKLGADADATRAQWRDLARVAGTGEVVAFGSRYESLDAKSAPWRVVAADAPAGELAPWPSGYGLTRTRGIDHGPVRHLQLLPVCLPVDLGEAVASPNRPARPVVFTATNVLSDRTDLHYVFTCTSSDGDRHASGLVSPGKGITTWTIPLALQVGEVVTWTVHVVGAAIEDAPVAVGTFTVPAKSVRAK
ncbi:MAG: hypothetical protein JNK15_10100 [Planctomycetes bacterium]|nr:hypothetical protein [Planctomycetota bacterium]